MFNPRINVEREENRNNSSPRRRSWFSVLRWLYRSLLRRVGQVWLRRARQKEATVGVAELTNQENRYRQIEDLFSTIAMDADEVTKQEVLAASQNWLALLERTVK
jgi:hypothetical protein